MNKYLLVMLLSGVFQVVNAQLYRPKPVFGKNLVIGANYTYMFREGNISNVIRHREHTLNFNLGIELFNKYYRAGVEHKYIQTTDNRSNRQHFYMSGIYHQFNFLPRKASRIYIENSWQISNLCNCNPVSLDPIKRNGLFYMGLGYGANFYFSKHLDIDMSLIFYSNLHAIPDKEHFPQYVIGLDYHFYPRNPPQKPFRLRFNKQENIIDDRNWTDSARIAMQDTVKYPKRIFLLNIKPVFAMGGVNELILYYNAGINPRFAVDLFKYRYRAGADVKVFQSWVNGGTPDWYYMAGLYNQLDLLPKRRGRLYIEGGIHLSNLCLCSLTTVNTAAGQALVPTASQAPFRGYVSIGGGFSLYISKRLDFDFSSVVLYQLNPEPEKYVMRHSMFGFSYYLEKRNKPRRKRFAYDLREG